MKNVISRCIILSLLCVVGMTLGHNLAIITTNGSQDTESLLPDTIERVKVQPPAGHNVKQLFQRRNRRGYSPNYNTAPAKPFSPAIPDYIQNWRGLDEDPAVFGMGTGLWDWSEPAEHHKSIVRIHTGVQNGRKTDWYMGTGVITAVVNGKYQILTCSHVIHDGIKLVVRFSDGTISTEGEILKELSSSTSDSALISMSIPENSRLKPVQVATNAPTMNEVVECCGYGGSSNGLRTFYCEAGPMTSRQRTIVYQSFAPGDSGGPVFNDKQELIGLMSRAAIDWWYPEPALVYRGREVKLAWPGLFVGLKPINGVLR